MTQTTQNKTFEPLLIGTVEQLNQYWNAVIPLLQKYINRCVSDEESLENIYTSVAEGRAFMFVVKADTVDGPEVDLVLVLELVQYSKYSAMEIKVLSGRNLMLYAKKYWDYVCGWAYMSGVRALEGHVPPALERLVGQLGLTRTQSCIQVRMPLVGK